MRHLDGDGDYVDVGAVHEVLGVIERARHSEALAGGVGGFAPAGGQRRDLEVVRERPQARDVRLRRPAAIGDRKSTRLNSSHVSISYAVFCLKKKKKKQTAEAQ